MRLKFSFPKGLVPSDNFRFTHVDGHVTLRSDPAAWYDEIAKQERDNGRELATDWKEQAQDQLCRILPPGFCTYDDGSTQSAYINLRMTRDDYMNGMSALAHVALDSDPFVSKEEADSRARTCAACPANVPIEGCQPCLNMVGLIMNIKGSATTEADPLLKACGICHCSNKAQVHVKSELLAKGVTEEQKRQFSLIEYCWKRQALGIPLV